jgi:hypothetical protein
MEIIRHLAQAWGAGKQGSNYLEDGGGIYHDDHLLW